MGQLIYLISSYMKKVLPLFIIILLFLPFAADAAEIFFGVKSKDITLDSKFEIGVFINTQAQDINAVEGEIRFPSEYVDVQGVYSGGSIISFWVSQPKLAGDGLISFTGVAPGGFNGSKGYLFTVIFKAKKTGNVSVSAANEEVLLNDGQGSSAVMTKAPLALEITRPKAVTPPSPTSASEASQDVPPIPPDDAVPPEPFEVQLAKSNNIFDGKWFVTFATQDKASGIDHYEVMEEAPSHSFRGLFSKSQFKTTESPYLLQDQTLKSSITIKAVDKAGNERLASIAPENTVAWYENYVIWIIIVLIGLLSLFLVSKKSWIKKRLLK
ncbi:MAG: cohesin domain-containing protein [bacterium]|nr:cohesin domain-containing protein [bacterium]